MWHGHGHGHGHVCVHRHLLLRARQLLPVLRMLRARARRLLGRLLQQRRRLPRALRRGARRALRHHGARTGAGVDSALRRGNLKGRKVRCVRG